MPVALPVGLLLLTLGFAISFLGQSCGIAPSTSSPSPSPDPVNRQYNIPPGFGAVFWSGQYAPSPSGQNLSAGINALAAKGFQTLKIPIDPSDLKGAFGLNGLNYNQNNFLYAAANNPTVVAALGNPSIQNIVLSVYDAIVVGTDGASRNFTNQIFLQAQQSAIVSTYYDLALSLFRNYKHTGKTFIISSWETENSLYCGSAYSFEKNAPNGFRDTCLANYQSTYHATNPQAAFQAVALWFSYRQQGIQQARAQAQAESDTGVTVESGIEFVTVHMIHDLGYPTVLYDLLPANKSLFDVLTYSAYESTNLGNLVTDFPTIQTQAAGVPIVISEFGFQRGLNYTVAGTSFSADQMMTTTVQQIQNLISQNSLGFAILWQAFQDGSAQDFGLLDNSANNTNLMVALLKGLGITP